MNERSRKEKRKTSVFRAVFIAFIAVALLIAGFRVIHTYSMYREARTEYDSLRNEAVKVNEKALFDSSYPPVSVDFDRLKEKNPDIRAWVCIAPIETSYPVVRGRDNFYYRNRTFMEKENSAGCIYIDYRSDSGFNDPNTVIYGAAVKNGSMFGSLHKISKDHTFSTDPYIWVMVPGKSMRYRIFSIHEDVRGSGVYSFFNGKDSGFVQYAQKMASESDIPLDIPEFSKSSRVITLSAETSEGRGNYVVQAVLDKTVES